MSSALLNSKDIKAQALRLGFANCGFAKAEPVAEPFSTRFLRWLELGCCADMDYLRRNVELRLQPDNLVPGVRTIVSLAMNFMPASHQPAISLYAQGRDYHDVLRERMHELMETCGLEGRCFVDTAPVLERYWAWKSGVGTFTRSGLIAVPGYGPTVFLGELFLTSESDSYDVPLSDALPEQTGWTSLCPALTADGLDARRCVSYQTIEHRGPLQEDVRLSGSTFYGCDRCLRATPQFVESHPTTESAFQPSESLLRMTPEDWSDLTEEQYRTLFKGSAVKRAKYEGLKRNIERWQASRIK